MANHSSSYPILCASFNQDTSYFAIGTRDGFKVFDSETGTLRYERAIGGFIIVEMLFSSSLLAIVGAAIFIPTPSLFVQHYHWSCPPRTKFFNFCPCHSSK
ncbi:autophagy-related protein 18b-like isoform X2 [Vitis riparia]|uniref:autophagy-related protein 18b-like isoform X2 n=1 Tax=Vitis riparia TaxID=96939 RepID=UPI00155ADDB0|nr:autophagy-related protein 18b-like isoform X2 [Vitis riparia]